MDPSGFIYNPNQESESDAFSGILEIHVHHARNIHNICIYDYQDVYAKFSLTYNPDETLSTRIINGGGKNPDFNQDLIMKINQLDAVLKCEIWMLSRAKNYMDDQLLGFVLVPISSLFGKGKVTQDYHLSSTDLFHSPAGTIKLSLSLNARTPLKSPLSVSFSDSLGEYSSATSQLLLDKKIPDEYNRLEFPDINVASENQQMVSEYFAKNRTVLIPDGSFLHLGQDYEMAANSDESVSLDGSIQNSGFLSSTMTSLSDDRNSADSMEKKHIFQDFSTSSNENEPTSKKKNESKEENEPKKEVESNTEVNNLVRNIKVDPEESAMQQQIVDMYMRSMQQFTESLAKMKLPMDFDKPQEDVIEKKMEIEKTKKDNSRVFYGSRAFF
ncbi:hypothetical protein CDL12_20941 [Handroanthus impetiginosus]|uniref:C2 domain-containing protein n=1 Tax=Handroanthus impetiginosus TaxID=429701 RepID=A0A2G9GMM7_9LAMI|nr:hypothetical protein CDL12_20941 [Handroanthus impetiginosus]